jgi:hypothetical protein
LNTPRGALALLARLHCILILSLFEIAVNEAETNQGEHTAPRYSNAQPTP